MQLTKTYIFGLLIVGCILMDNAVLLIETNPTPKLNVTDSYIDVMLNSTLYLDCSGKSPIFWYFEDPITKKNSLLQNDSQDLGNYFKSVLHLEFHSSKKTGKYFCCFNQICPKNQTSIYVFVNDKEQLLLPVEDAMFHVIQIFEANPTIIPCLPTISGAEMSLWKGSRKEKLVNISENVRYDPKMGFNIISSTNYFSGNFHCKAKWEGIQQKLDLYLDFVRQSRIIPQVFIDVSKVEYILVNSSFTLTCTVNVEVGTNMLISWHHPPGVDVNRVEITREKKQKPKEKNDLFDRYTKDITVHKVQKEDEGYYQCNVTDFSKRENFAEALIKIYENPLQPVVILEPGNPEVLTKERGDSVQFFAKYKVFPFSKQVYLNWERGGQILKSKSGKYIVDVTADEMKLTISNLENTDIGTYFLMAEAPGGSSNISYELRVKDVPTVNITSEESFYYTFGKEYLIICQAVGFPLPDVCLFAWKPYVIGSENADDYFELSKDLHPNGDRVTNTTTESNMTVILKLRVVAKQSGYYQCTSRNEMGFENEEIPFFVTDIPEGFWISSDSPEPIEYHHFSMTCSANAMVYREVIWSWKHDSSSEFSSNFTKNVEKSQSAYSISVMFTIDTVTQNESGTYKCTGIYRNASQGANTKSVKVQVKAMKAPYIIKSNMNSTIMEVNPNQYFELSCFVGGVPKPVLSWYKDEELLTTNMSGRAFVEDFQKLVINRIVDKDNGDYECRAENDKGRAFQKTTLLVLSDGSMGSVTIGKDDSKLITILTVVGLGVLVITLVVLVLLGRRIYKKKRQKEQFQLFSHKIFQEGQLSLFDPELPLDDQAELLPYDHRWEFPRENLKLGRTLGQGAFGRVVKAEALGLTDDETSTTVAVKMLKERADKNQQRALMAELKILIHLGHHVNIVNLLGAVTKNIPRGELFVMVEYCRYGNIRHYLLKYRENFVNQVDGLTGKIDFSRVRLPSSPAGDKGHDYENSSLCTSSASRTSNNSPVTSPGLAVENPNYKERGMHPEKVRFFPNKSVNKPISTSSSSDTRYTTSGRFSAAENYCRMDSREHTITTSDLLCYAFQCARGMEYLASRKLIHRDLAARNILLTEDDIVKICDFGLAKDCYKYSSYVKKGDGPLPVKWLAIESIGDKVFTTKSDVWSFGILLWEFFTLGGNPYPGIDIDEEFYRKLKCGYRLEKPPYAPDAVYQIMQDCWQSDPVKRPDFLQLSDMIGELLECGVTQYYIDLNEPYIQMNERILIHDYLNVKKTEDSPRPKSPHAATYVNSSILSSTTLEYDSVPPVRSVSDSEVPKEAMEMIPMIHFEPSPKNCNKTLSGQFKRGSQVDVTYVPDYQCMTHKLNNYSDSQCDDSGFYDR